MQRFLDFLNANSGALSLLFSAVVMVATVVYAWLTARLVSETRQLRKAQTEPRVEVFFRLSEHWINFLDICVKNIGAGPAYDLQFRLTAESKSVGTDQLYARLEKLGCFKRGLAYLGPGQEFVSFWDSLVEGDSSRMQARFSVKCEYRDALRNHYSNSAPLDLSELEGTSTIGERPLHAIAKHIDNLQKAIHSLATGSTRLKVDAYSTEDRARERQELKERIEQHRKPNAP
jgi:hypothetical protein